MHEATASLYCDSKSTTLIENDKSDKSYLPTFCWNASKNYLNLNKEDAIIAEGTLLISNSLLTNSEQGKHTTSDPASIMNDEISLARSTIATIQTIYPLYLIPIHPLLLMILIIVPCATQNLHRTLC